MGTGARGGATAVVARGKGVKPRNAEDGKASGGVVAKVSVDWGGLVVSDQQARAEIDARQTSNSEPPIVRNSRNAKPCP